MLIHYFNVLQVVAIKSQKEQCHNKINLQYVFHQPEYFFKYMIPPIPYWTHANWEKTLLVEDGVDQLP